MAEKIKVLIVDDNEETRYGTQRLLEYEDNIEIIGIAENGQIAIERVKELEPHVVLMDINMPVMDGLTATRTLQQEAPRTQVIVVSVQDDTQYLKEAFRAGAVDFVAKPITSDELSQAIQRAYAKIPAQPMAPPVPGPDYPIPGPGYPVPGRESRVICVLGPKGGVGKTLVAVNLGVGLVRAAHDNKVIVVDSNLYFGDVGLFMNTRGQLSIVDLAIMAEDPDQLDPHYAESALMPHESGVKLLVGPTGDDRSIPYDTMVNLINYLKGEFDYVVIDTATMFDEVLIAAYQSSDRLVVVATPTMPALKDTRILFNALVGEEYSMDQVMLVLNQVDRNSNITAEQIGNFLKHPVAIEIPTDPTAIAAINQGTPLVTMDPRRSVAVQPLMELVDVVRASFEEKAVVPDEDDYIDQSQVRRGLFGRR